MGNVITEEKTWIVYRRMVDLTKFDTEILKKYNLENFRYVYVGQCETDRIEQRTRDFVWKIKNRMDIEKKVRGIEPETAIIYQNINKFFMEYKGMTQEQAYDYMFKVLDNCFLVIDKNIKSESDARELESKYDNGLRIMNLVNKESYILKNFTTDFEQIDEVINLKKNHNYTMDLK